MTSNPLLWIIFRWWIVNLFVTDLSATNRQFICNCNARYMLYFLDWKFFLCLSTSIHIHSIWSSFICIDYMVYCNCTSYMLHLNRSRCRAKLNRSECNLWSALWWICKNYNKNSKIMPPIVTNIIVLQFRT